MCYTDLGIFSEFKFFFKALYYQVSLQGKLPFVLLYTSFLLRLILTQVKGHLFHIAFIWCQPQPFPLFSFLLHCFTSLCSTSLIYTVSSAKAIWPNAHPNYGELRHKDGVRGVILVLLIQQDLNPRPISFFQ